MLVKTSVKKITNFVLPVVISTKKGIIKVNRYYDNEYELFKAYRQLKRINGYMKPLYPIIYDWEVLFVKTIDFTKYVGSLERISYSDKDLIVIMYCDDGALLSFKFGNEEKYNAFLECFREVEDK